MSEYQYYEFQTLDRALSAEDRAALRAVSTRATITSRSFTNEYQWGSFKGDPEQWMRQYFDAHVYLSNFGSRNFHLRLPLGVLDTTVARQYELENVLEISGTKEHLVICCYCNDDSGEWGQDEHDDQPGEVMGRLLPLRDELLRGDLRMLYLVWLHALNSGYAGTDELEPPVPPGLKKLTAAQESLAGFFWLDQALVEVAARHSEELPPGLPAQDLKSQAADWLATLSGAEKDQWLTRFLEEESSQTEVLLRLALRGWTAENRAPAGGRQDGFSTLPRRTGGELQEAAEAFREEKQAAEQKQATAERLKYMQGLAGQEPRLWQSVMDLTATNLPRNYDAAVLQLLELRELADLTGTSREFAGQLTDLRALRVRKVSLLDRMDQVRLK